MSGFGIKVDFKEVTRFFEKQDSGIDKLKEFLAGELIAVSQQAFEKEEDPETGKPWPKSIRAKLEGGQTLSDNANLKRSIASDTSSDAIIVGTPLLYGRVHMLGAIIKPKNKKFLKFNIGDNTIFAKSVTIPERRFLGIPDDFNETIGKGITRIYGL